MANATAPHRDWQRQSPWAFAGFIFMMEGRENVIAILRRHTGLEKVVGPFIQFIDS
jgi:hypothetical protein